MRWEYNVIRIPRSHMKPELQINVLNELGFEGWELVYVLHIGNYITLYLKRPKVIPK